MTHIPIIFLNGPLSSGKSSLARELQRRLSVPYIYFPEDMFFSGLPRKDYPSEEMYQYGSRLYHGFTQCVRTMVETEHRVIVDTVAWVPGSLAGFVEALWELPVFAVGLYCDLAVLEARERQRGDRGVGLARQQSRKAHQDAQYDLAIDTSTLTIDQCATQVVEAMAHPATPHAFARMKAQFGDG
jgi:chloramphenicol 3-O phosphotransferase